MPFERARRLADDVVAALDRQGGMYDAEDDPDRLYFSRGLGRLDSDDDSGDDGSAGLGDGDEDWADDVVSGQFPG